MLKDMPFDDRLRLNPKPDTRPRKPRPVEPLAGIGLPRGRNIGMTQHPARRDRMARENVPAQRLHCPHLRFGIRRAAKIMPAIHDLDADGAAIDVALPGPMADTRMPGPQM